MTETLDEIYQRYKSHDPSGPGFGDKGTVHSYIDIYEDVLSAYRNTAKQVLEIGILNGSSLRMWEEYFSQSKVYGIDIDQKPLGLFDLTHMVAEGTHNILFLDSTLPEEVEAALPGAMFDVIIDDASHALEHQLAIYENFKRHLSPGGIYIIEDVADIDASRHEFEKLDRTKCIEIIDLRHLKGRFDDVMVIVR